MTTARPQTIALNQSIDQAFSGSNLCFHFTICSGKFKNNCKLQKQQSLKRRTQIFAHLQAVAVGGKMEEWSTSPVTTTSTDAAVATFRSTSTDNSEILI